MKPLKIDVANIAKIVTALKAVNGKAAEHSYTTFEEIEDLAEEAEALAQKILGAKKHFPGASYHATSGDSVANAYKYSRLGTEVLLERRSSAWYLVAANQAQIWNSGGTQRLYLTPAQDEAAIAHLRKGYIVKAKTKEIANDQSS